MQINISLDYNEITFTHDVLADPLVGTMLLKYIKNCGTEVELDISSFIGSIVDNTLTLNVTDIDATKTVFDDGVYTFTLEITGPLVDGETGLWTLKGCVYIGTTSRCKALCLYEATGNEMVRYLINALSIVNDCDDCDCSTQCDVYDYLITLITGTSTTTNNVYNSCGCN